MGATKEALVDLFCPVSLGLKGTQHSTVQGMKQPSPNGAYCSWHCTPKDVLNNASLQMYSTAPYST